MLAKNGGLGMPIRRPSASMLLSLMRSGPAECQIWPNISPYRRRSQDRKRHTPIPEPGKSLDGLRNLHPGMKVSALSGSTLLLSLASLSLLSPTDAHALQTVTVNVGGKLYNVNSITTSYSASTNLFNTPANGGSMPWWGGTPPYVGEFVSAVTTSLGTPNLSGTGAPTLGPFFAALAYASNFQSGAYNSATGLLEYPIRDQSGTYTFATATAVVPSPLPFLGAAAAFGMSRRLRQRIRSAS